MQDAQDRRHVDQPVQGAPAASAETFDHAGRRGGGERREEEERADADRDEGALHDVRRHLLPVEEEVEDDPDGEVEGRVREREEPEQPPHRDRRRAAGDDPQRRQRQAREKNPKRPVAERPRDEVDGIRAEVPRQGARDQIAERRETGEPHGALENDARPAAQ